MKTKRQWTVKNAYGISGNTTHESPESAIRAASRREGDGWIVIDESGNQWGLLGTSEAVIVRHNNREA